jgi:hypothetical protein
VFQLNYSIDLQAFYLQQSMWVDNIVEHKPLLRFKAMEFEGLWCVRFEAGHAWGYGHVAFTGGKILGGDSWWRYVGQYEIAGD